MEDWILLVAIWSAVCFLAGLVFQQSISINLLNQLFKDEISDEEKDKEKDEEKSGGEKAGENYIDIHDIADAD